GALVKDIPELFGEIYSMNITNDPEVGIGKWTDGEIAYFLRTGLRKDGSYAPTYMPKFPLVSDEDLKSIIAWLRSGEPAVQASKEEPQKSKPSLFTKFLCNVLPAGKPFPYPKEPIAIPDSNNAVAYGKYLATNLYACFACHSKSFPTNNELEPEKSEGFFGGGNVMKDLNGNEVKTRNITPDAATGIGSWTEEQFVTALRTGKTPNGQVKYPMMPYTLLTDLEAKAIYAYLKTVPAINNKVQ
ncbi:MAG TPA: cytochrome c, partial [Bacteroidia bacterium]|nr:cytochrome c [Bacteroidia bacterium]